MSRSAIAAPGFDEGFDLQWSNTITYAGDFDGDGMKDILLNYGDATGFRALYSTGAGFKQEWTLAWSPTNVYVGDFNGDGRDDFLINYGDSTGFRVLYAHSMGYGFYQGHTFGGSPPRSTSAITTATARMTS
nr:VCBS repeat-containing protein [Nannocystis pusilla]